MLLPCLCEVWIASLFEGQVLFMLSDSVKPAKRLSCSGQGDLNSTAFASPNKGLLMSEIRSHSHL